jgi:Zn-dependent protease
MQDVSTWSLSLGRWGGLHIRLHALFLFFALAILYLATLAATGSKATPVDGALIRGLAESEPRDPARTGRREGQVDHAEHVWLVSLALAILFVSVLLHELAHCGAAVRMGGHCDEVLLYPLGGLKTPSVPHQPQSELTVALAGPLVNFVLCAIVLPPVLISASSGSRALLHPILHPAEISSAPLPAAALLLAFWINLVLGLVNLLPAYPFDGASALRALIWPACGKQTAALISSRVAKSLAALTLLSAWLFRDLFAATSAVPAWLPLSLLALFLYFGAERELADEQEHDDSLGYDFSQGYTSLHREDRRPRQPTYLLKAYLRWRDKRRRSRELLERQREEAEEARVDAILARLHKTGIDGLAAEDRALLERVSARYRSRLGQ